MKKVPENLRLLIFSIVALLMIVVSFKVFSYKAQDENWINEPIDVKVNDVVYENLDIGRAELPSVKRGDKVEITKKLNKSAYENTSLVLRVYGTTVDVFLEDKNIYSYGNDLYAKKKMVGRGYHMVPIEVVDEKNPTLVVKLTITEDMSSMWLDFFRFTSSNNIWGEIFKDNLFSIMLYLFLFMLGIVGYFVSLAMFFKTKIDNSHQLYSFAVSFFVGLWNLCTVGFLQFITNNYEYNSFIEYASIYVAGFFYLSTMEFVEKEKNVRSIKIISIMKYFYIAFIFISFTMHFTGLKIISQTISQYRIVVCVSLITVFYTIIVNYKQQEFYEKIFIVGNIVGLCLTLIHVVLLNLEITTISVFGNKFALDNTFTTMAILIIIAAPLLNHTMKMQEMDKYEKQIAVFKQIAYKDQMTGLDNRYGGLAFVMEMKKLHIPYNLVMYDLNNLKIVNDTHGHNVGDELIINFAKGIKKVFDSENSINIRQGGDEFITIVRASTKEELEEKITELKKYFEGINEKDENKGHLDFAYGVASSSEVLNGNYEDTLKLADDRMYENKISTGRADDIIS